MQADIALFQDTLVKALARLGIASTNDQLEKLTAHYLKLIEANKQFNLTRITAPVEAAVKHYADSLSILPCLRQLGVTPRRFLDIGTGAGFPSFPFAVFAEKCLVSAVDSTAKKASFLRDAVGSFGVSNLQSVHAHTDHWQTDSRFDVVACRAFGSIEKCLFNAHRFVQSNGFIITYKTEQLAPTELREGSAAARELQLIELPPFNYNLAFSDEVLHRQLVAFKRV